MSQYEELSDVDFPDNFGYTHRSLFFLSMTLGEMSILAKDRHKTEEYDLLRSSVFQKYNASLMYTFIMEYCKLLEPDKGNGNYASLHRLNNKVFQIKGQIFKAEYDKVQVDIDTLIQSDFHHQIRFLRDKKFAHSDKFQTGSDFSVKAFTDQQMQLALAHFNSLNHIHDRCAFQFGAEYIITMDDDRTDNFIKRQSKFGEFYLKNNKDDWDI